MCNTVLVKDESNFHTGIDARVLESQNDVIVSASPESNLRTFALARTSLWHAVDDYCQFNEAHMAPPAFWFRIVETPTRKEIDFLGSRAASRISRDVFSSHARMFSRF